MKKALCLLLLFAAVQVRAQNVGIGTTTPLARLQVNLNGNTIVGLRLVDSGASRLGAIKFSSINQPVAMYLSGNYESSFNKGQYLHISSDSALVATFRGDGNVGIGTATPSEKLEIKKPLKSTLKISAASLSDTTQILLSNIGSTSGLYTDFYIKSIREEGLFFISNSDLPTYNSANSLVIKPGGNIGMGNSNPASKLDVNGDINTNGRLRVNGNAGTAGQVLTSNGNANPTWSNAAFANSTRFGISGAQGSFANSNLNLGTSYNTNPTDITVSATSFTINKTGLYHLEGSFGSQADFTPSAATIPDINLRMIITGTAATTHFLLNEEMRKDDAIPPSYQSYLVFRTFSSDIYVNAGTTISFTPQLVASLTNLSNFGHSLTLRGYLISE